MYDFYDSYNKSKNIFIDMIIYNWWAINNNLYSHWFITSLTTFWFYYICLDVVSVDSNMCY